MEKQAGPVTWPWREEGGGFPQPPRCGWEGSPRGPQHCLVQGPVQGPVGRRSHWPFCNKDSSCGEKMELRSPAKKKKNSLATVKVRNNSGPFRGEMGRKDRFET